MKCCSKCGGQVNDDASICMHCGCALNAQPNNQAYSQTNRGPVAQLSTNRSLLKFILLSMITFGIYGIVVMSAVSTDINTIAGRYDNKKTTHYCLMCFLLSWLTLGIYPLVWFHQLSNRIGTELNRRHIPYSFNAGSFWLWSVLGSFIYVGPLVYTHKLLHSMNLLAADYNLKG